MMNWADCIAQFAENEWDFVQLEWHRGFYSPLKKF